MITSTALRRLVGASIVSALAALLALSNSASTSPAGTAPAMMPHVTGVWYITAWFGPPQIADTPTLEAAITLHADRTVLVSATDHTGKYPLPELFPGAATPGHGIWEPTSNGIRVKFFEFADKANPTTPGLRSAVSTFSVSRVIAELTFQDQNTLIGTAGVDSLLCPKGPLQCQNPNSKPFPTTNPNVTTRFVRVTFQ